MAYWNTILYSQGASAVALYQDYLHRQPGTGEVAVWVNATATSSSSSTPAPLTLLQIEAGVLGSTEFFNNG